MITIENDYIYLTLNLFTNIFLGLVIQIQQRNNSVYQL